MTSRCSTCGISYPYQISRPCSVCGNATSGIYAEPDPDWKDKVSAALATQTTPDDNVSAWRFAEAMRSGLSPEHASFVAQNRYIDLETLRRLCAEAGPALAFEILQ